MLQITKTLTRYHQALSLLSKHSVNPFVFTSKRLIYDLKAQKVAFKQQRKELKKLSHPENIDLFAALEIFKTYTLNQDLPLSLHIELTESAVGGAGIFYS